MTQALLSNVELLNRIFSYISLQPEILSKLCLVNRVFYCIISSDQFWRRIWFKKYPGSMGIITKNYRSSYILMRQYWKTKCQPIYKSKKRAYNNPYHLEDRDHARIGMFGEEGVGKTAIVTRYTQVEYSYRKVVKLHDNEVRLEILDTAAGEEYSKTGQKYLRICDGGMFCFSVSDRRSFTFIAEEIQKALQMDKPVIMVGCKNELSRAVSFQEAQHFAQHHKIHYVETSAKRNTNITSAFQVMLEHILYQQLYFIPAFKAIANKEQTSSKCCVM
ncbi:hypothetical protein AKO1_010770 [Acrasis kona]|uniref:F-box domain-containing protein n=1 Tax=Acrasis kona TaxID=1008807 RepID=A0AAW2YMP8_9EUKA